MTRLFPILLASLVLMSCSSGHYQTKNESRLPSSADTPVHTTDSGCILQQPAGTNYQWIADTAWVNSTLRSLSLREKIGQMIVPFTYARYMSDNSNSYDDLSHLVNEFHVGGFVMSIGNVYEEAMLINRLQKISKIPLLFASDFEYGLGMRLQDAVSFPMNMALGATRDTALAFEIGHAVGNEARAIGVLQVYAPVSDVNDNPENPIINVRSFGENPQLVGRMASAWAMGAQEAGVVATAKHFPGHGDTQVDSHTQLPTINYPYSRLDTLELVPFRDDIAAGIKSVMVAHIAFPLFQHEVGVPATLSRQITTGMLRDSLGFRGLIVTDALTMGGVTKDYSTAEAAVRAVNAGADILLMPPDDRIAVDAIVKAVHDGVISRARIDSAVKEILTIKSELGLEKRRFVDVDDISKIIGSMNHELLAQKAARKSITIVRNVGNFLPLQYHQPQQLLCLTVSDDGDPSTGERFRNELAERCDNITYAQINPASNQMNFDDVYKMAENADAIVIACYVQWGAGQGTVDFTPPVKGFLNKIAALNKPCIMVSFGNPYLLRSVPIVPAYVCAYSSSRYSVNAAVQALFGEINVTGKLPVTIPNSADYGDGVMLPKTSLQYASPQEAGFNPERLDKLDSLMNYWVAKGAFPGAQLLVARHGMIAYDKCFGTLDTSLYSRRVQPNTMFDLASLTKVVATTFAAMRLYDEGKLDLEAPVARYLPQFAQDGKSKVTIRDLLVHDSGLPPDPPHFLWETGAIPQNQLQRLLKDPHAFVYADSFGTNFH
ncbi:MAG: serine hydrolase, partial [Bacteroidetes bacterium]|nr:serine hydrolase [Bacteroidota bacterium]